MTTQSVSVQSLPIIFWQNQPVITTELLASVYDVQEKQIRQNFTNNADRFVDGIHCFKLTGSNLRDFRHRVENIDSVVIGKNANALMLWTERGTVRHAKMLGTDKAWEIQDELETFYFTHKTKTAQPYLSLSTYPTPEQYESLVKSIKELSFITVELTKVVQQGEYIARNEQSSSTPDLFTPCDNLELENITHAICSGFHLESSFKIAINLRLLQTIGVSPDKYTKRHLPMIVNELNQIMEIIQNIRKNNVQSELNGLKLMVIKKS